MHAQVRGVSRGNGRCRHGIGRCRGRGSLGAVEPHRTRAEPGRERDVRPVMEGGSQGTACGGTRRGGKQRGRLCGRQNAPEEAGEWREAAMEKQAGSRCWDAQRCVSCPQPRSVPAAHCTRPHRTAPAQAAAGQAAGGCPHVRRHVDGHALTAASDEMSPQSSVRRWPARSSEWSDSWHICAVLQTQRGVYSHFCLLGPTDVLICVRQLW